MTITDLEAYRAGIEASADPADLIQVEATRATWDWIAADLQKRRKKLKQAAGDPNTKATKREKRQRELDGLDAALTAIHNAKLIAK